MGITVGIKNICRAHLSILLFSKVLFLSASWAKAKNGSGIYYQSKIFILGTSEYEFLECVYNSESSFREKNVRERIASIARYIYKVGGLKFSCPLLHAILRVFNRMIHINI